jgi:hypothetical protein
MKMYFKVSGDAYSMSSRYAIASNGNSFLVEDKKTGLTVSRHHTYAAALKARNAVSSKAAEAR